MIGRIGRTKLLAVIGLCALALGVGVAISKEDNDPADSGTRVVASTGSGAANRPNIVFVLTDDLSMNLLRYMPAVQGLEQAGMTFDNYYVSDSLCCPSRASIFTGDFPHDTGVYSNQGANGGFEAFHAKGDQNSTFNVALQQAGYRTAMMGKYLNGYLDPQEGGSGVPDNYVPPGWNEWDVAGWGYPEYNYDMNVNGTVVHYGNRPQDYLTDVLADRGVSFINSTSASGQPFFLELASFSPHWPYTPAPRYANAFPGVTAPEGPQFDRLPANPPSWLGNRPPLTGGQIQHINDAFRLRVQSVQAVNDMIYRVEQALAANGELKNTYIVFSSDNGLHMGEYRLMPGKMTAFDTDIHVPLVVMGPGVPAGSQNNAMTENIDLAKTFTAIGGTTLPGDGHSLYGLLQGQTPTDWRNAVLIEHHGPTLNRADPDFQYSVSGNPTTYEAIRTPDFLYVEYDNGEREYYDLRTDPFELDNIVSTLPPDELAQLHQDLAAMENCHGGASCWAATHVPDGSAVTTQLRRARHVTVGGHHRRGHLHHRRGHLHHRRHLDRKRRLLHRHLSSIPFGYRRHNRQAKAGTRAI
jgi:arylsulfatase A-like enzyme